MQRAPTPGRRIDLARRAVTSEVLRGEGLSICCDRGSLWVTVEGFADDVILEAGDCVVLSGRGKVVVEALKSATAVLRPRALEATAFARFP